MFDVGLQIIISAHVMRKGRSLSRIDLTFQNDNMWFAFRRDLICPLMLNLSPVENGRQPKDPKL